MTDSSILGIAGKKCWEIADSKMLVIMGDMSFILLRVGLTAHKIEKILNNANTAS
jgi:hypothetical protein